MSYSDFSPESFKSRFGVPFRLSRELGAGVERLPPGELLAATLRRNVPWATAMNTEKARSEMLVSPVLLEVREQLGNQIGLFSGVGFNVDPDRGLTGVCDFLLDLSTDPFVVTAPVAVVVEAKAGDIEAGFGQCAAEMLAARLFNERAGVHLPTVGGAVTSGLHWRFLRLGVDAVEVSAEAVPIADADRVLGTLVALVNATRGAFESLTAATSSR